MKRGIYPYKKNKIYMTKSYDIMAQHIGKWFEFGSIKHSVA